MLIEGDAQTLPLVLARPHVAASVVRWVVALLVGLTGIADMFAVLYPRSPLAVLLHYWPLDFDVALRSFAAVIGFGMLMLAGGLVRGKRQAWQVTIALLGLSLLWQFSRGHVLAIMALTLLLGGMLGALAPFFRARSDTPSVWRGYLALLGGGLIIYLYALGGTLVLEHRFAPLESIDRVIDGFVHIIDDAPFISNHLTHSARLWIFERSLVVLTCTAFLYGLAELLRPALKAFQAGHHDRAAAGQLIHRWGANSLAAFALAPDKRYYLAPRQQGVLAYVVAERVAVAAGDPIAAPDDIPQVLHHYVRWCHEHDLSPAFWQVRDTYLAAYRQLGLQTMKIGEEALVALPEFTLKGGAMQNVRTTMRHAEKAGVTVRFFTGRIDDPTLAAEVTAISRAWLAAKGGGEMGFSMGRWDDAYLPDRQIAVACDAEGHARAFTTFVPIYGRQGWALDLMRRGSATPAGAMELLLVSAIERFRAEGAQVLSLGLAPLANSTGEPTTNIGQLCSTLSHRFGSNKQAASLHNFKRKFAPTWEARYIVYPGTLALPRVGLAVLSAHLCHSWRSVNWLRSLLPQGAGRVAPTEGERPAA